MPSDVDLIREYVRSVLETSGSHGFDHIERVTALCERIGREEDADMGVLIPAALFHDIARPREKAEGIPHEQEGARMAEAFLSGLPYTGGIIPAISHAIRAHRFRSTEKPATLEARILSDADKLDAMGALGIARTFMRAGEHHGTIDDAVSHFHDKLLVLHERMYTDSARRIAGERHALMLQFLAALSKERMMDDS